MLSAVTICLARLVGAQELPTVHGDGCIRPISNSQNPDSVSNSSGQNSALCGQHLSYGNSQSTCSNGCPRRRVYVADSRTFQPRNEFSRIRSKQCSQRPMRLLISLVIAQAAMVVHGERELRPTRSGGKPSTPYLTLTTSDIASEAEISSTRHADLPSALSRYAFFRRHSGRKTSTEDSIKVHIRGMFATHRETPEDVLLIEIDHAATSKFPTMFMMPGVAELFYTLRPLGDHTGQMWTVPIAGHLLELINQQTNVIIATKQDGFTSSVPNLAWFCAVAAPFKLRVAIDTHIADGQAETGRDSIAECKESEDMTCR